MCEPGRRTWTGPGGGTLRLLEKQAQTKVALMFLRVGRTAKVATYMMNNCQVGFLEIDGSQESQPKSEAPTSHPLL